MKGKRPPKDLLASISSVLVFAERYRDQWTQGKLAQACLNRSEQRHECQGEERTILHQS